MARREKSERARRDEKLMSPSEALALDAGNITERGLLVTLSVSRWYGTGNDAAVVSDVATRAEARGNIGSFSKRSMERRHLERINAVTAEARRYHKMMTLPWGDAMQRLLSVDAFIEFKSKMTGYEHAFGRAVEDFLVEYPRLIVEQKARLGKLFKESDYPSVEELRTRFKFRLAVDRIPTSDASDLRLSLGAEQAEEIRREVEQRTHDAVAGSVRDIYERMMEAVTAIRETITERDSIGPKALESLAEVCTLLPKLNLMHDPNIAAIGDEVMRELGSVDRAALRDDPTLRASTVKKADALLNKMAVFKKGTK